MCVCVAEVFMGRNVDRDGIDLNLTICVNQMVLIKAILHANWTLTNEYPPFCNAKKSTSKTLVQKGCRAKC